MLAAAVTEMRFWHYLLAIFAGRFVRFLILSFLVLKFGPGFVQTMGTLFRHHLPWVLIALAAGLLIWLLLLRRSRKKKIATAGKAS
jgi:membrane protein DedA with SNARE-associated domain